MGIFCGRAWRRTKVRRVHEEIVVWLSNPMVFAPNAKSYLAQTAQSAGKALMVTISELCPSLAIRISRAQLLLLLEALKPVVCASLSQIYATDGIHPVLAELPRCIELHHEPLIRLWKRLNFLAETEEARYRSRLDAFEAAMCGLALRAATKRERKNPPSSDSQETIRPSTLMRKIENHRRRACRKFKLTVGAEAAELAVLLREYEMRLRTDSPPQWLKIRVSAPCRKTWIHRLVEYATEGLQEAGSAMPPVQEI